MRGGGKPAGSCLPCNQQARSAPFHDSPCVESPEIPLAPAPPATLPDLTLTSSHTVDSNTESAIARYRCLLVPRASSLSVTLRLGSFTRQVSPYFVLRPAPSPLYARPSPPRWLPVRRRHCLCVGPVPPFAPSLFDPRVTANRDSRLRPVARDGTGRTMRAYDGQGWGTNERVGESKRMPKFCPRTGQNYCPNPVPLRAQGSRSKPRPRERTDEPGLPVRYESSCLEGGPRSTLNSRGAKQEDSGMGRGAKGEDANDDDDDDDEGVCVIIYSV